MKAVIKNLIFTVALIVIVFLVWVIASAIIGEKLILPTPKQAFSELAFCLSRAWLYRAVLGTVLRSVIGFLLSFVLGVTLATISFRYKTAQKLLTPLISVFSSIPTMSVILIVLVWLSASATPVLVALIIIMPIIYSGTLNALNSIDPDLIEITRAVGGSNLFKIRKVYAPLIAPYVAETSARGISLNFKLVIAAEVLSQTKNSIGLVMQQSQIYFNTSRLFALTALAVIIATLIEYLMRLIKKAVSY